MRSPPRKLGLQFRRRGLTYELSACSVVPIGVIHGALQGAITALHDVIELQFSGTLPFDYIPEPVVRLNLYSRLQRFETHTEIDAFAEELEDRFGKPPLDDHANRFCTPQACGGERRHLQDRRWPRCHSDRIYDAWLHVLQPLGPAPRLRST